MLKKIKNRLAALAYLSIIHIVKTLPASSKGKHLLIIKTDEIGDYMLFRGYLRSIRASQKYKGYKITLAGNGAWKQLFEEYDKDTVDEAIWLNKKQFKKDLRYRFSFFQRVRRLQTSDVINGIFSRSLLTDDGLAFVATGDNKVAMKGDDTNRERGFGEWDSRIYSEVIDAGDQSVFDAVRNRNFVSIILGEQNIAVTMALPVKLQTEQLPQPYFIIFLGAGNAERKWPLSSFLTTAQYIQLTYGLMPVICGGPDDVVQGEEFLREYDGEAGNYAGKTTLLQLVALLRGAAFLLSVDTGAVHMAAAAGCPVIGLYSGKFYGRFAPYPAVLAPHFYPVYPDFVDPLIANNDPVLYDTFVMKNDTIKMIAPDKVLKSVDVLIKKEIAKFNT